MLIAVSRSACQSCIPGLDTPIINATCIIIEDRIIKAALESGGVDRLVGDEMRQAVEDHHDLVAAAAAQEPASEVSVRTRKENLQVQEGGKVRKLHGDGLSYRLITATST